MPNISFVFNSTNNTTIDIMVVNLFVQLFSLINGHHQAFNNHFYQQIFIIKIIRNNVINKAINICTTLFIFVSPFKLWSQSVETNYQQEIFWHTTGNYSIAWDITKEKRLPHSDNIEMSGKLMSAIISYTIDENKQLHVSRDIIFPQLRRYLYSGDPAYKSYRAYLRDTLKDNIQPGLSISNYKILPGVLDSVTINGKLNFFHHPTNGIKIIRTFLPALNERMLVEKWTIVNVTDTAINLSIGSNTVQQQETGLYGLYTRNIYSDAVQQVKLFPNKPYSFGIYFTAKLNDERTIATGWQKAESERDIFLGTMQNNMAVHTPDSNLNTLFYFSKIRAAESVFQTKMGLVHSPGGSNYYTGIWANDQGEYSGPLFAYLGYVAGVTAAMNAYKMFLKNIPKDGGKIWASFEMDGELPCCSKDRGDAAMLAYGATHFCLASGNKANADTLWPLIEWGLAYCDKMKNSQGVIASASDELEGRFPTGSANLSTACLYYGALKNAILLATAMGKPAKMIKDLSARKSALAASIEKYFGANIEGLNTYKYYKENTTLRSWICLPLVMGINNRREQTLDALFSKLWTANGVITELSDVEKRKQTFWDRGTLYSFTGAFKAGAADRALEKLQSFSTTRLTGFHVPYVVEAWPEGNMAHLSGESALYCRIFSEGILGLEPISFTSFSLQPNLPAAWNYYSVKNIHAFNAVFDISIVKEHNLLQLTVSNNGTVVINKEIKNGQRVPVNFEK